MKPDSEPLPFETRQNNDKAPDSPAGASAGGGAAELSSSAGERKGGDSGGSQQHTGQERTQADNPPDPFDPASLRLDQNFGASIGVKKLITVVPVRKPAKESWVQTHPDPAYRIETAVLELKEDKEIYLVDKPLWGDLATEGTFSPRALFTTITRQGTIFIWPVRLPGIDGKIDDWSKSALDAATRAEGSWIRVQSNMHAGFYEVWESTADIPDPHWPDVSFPDLLRIAFKDRRIDSLDHPVLRKLRGEI